MKNHIIPALILAALLLLLGTCKNPLDSVRGGSADVTLTLMIPDYFSGVFPDTGDVVDNYTRHVRFGGDSSPRIIDPATRSIDIVVSASDMETVEQSFTFDPSNAVYNGFWQLDCSIQNIPAGPDRTFAIDTKDAAGTVLTTGTAIVTLTAGKNNGISIPLHPANATELVLDETTIGTAPYGSLNCYKVTFPGPGTYWVNLVSNQKADLYIYSDSGELLSVDQIEPGSPTDEEAEIETAETDAVCYVGVFGNDPEEDAEYTITATGGGSITSAAKITSFTFTAADNNELSSDTIGVISGTTVTVTVPYATSLFSLVPTVEFNGKTLIPESGTAQDFRVQTIYTAIANDNSSVKYTVNVSAAQPSGVVPVFKTGQTTQYEPGDDGALERGRAWPSPRFTDNGDGTITDNMTGLMWEKSASLTTRLWAEAMDYANNSLVAGYDDWRLPNIFELQSLINHEAVSPATWLNGQGFQNIQQNYYWTSTTRGSDTTQAYRFWFNICDSLYGWKTSESSYCLAVRGSSSVIPKTGQTTSYYAEDDGALEMGVSWPNPRFTDNGDSTVTDNLTGLVWEQSPPGSTMTWTNALAYADSLGLGGYGDWRLPNTRELMSLFNMEYAAQYTWLNAQDFSGVAAGNYFSSTTAADNTANSIAINFNFAFMTQLGKAAPYNVWAVRGGE